MIVLVIIENSADYFDPSELIYVIKGLCILLHAQTCIDLINCHSHVNIFISLTTKISWFLIIVWLPWGNNIELNIHLVEVKCFYKRVNRVHTPISVPC